MILAIPKPSIFAAKKEYGRLIKFANFADRIKRRSEDNKEYNRPDQNAQEEKRMNFARKYAYILKIIPIFAVLITFNVTEIDAGRELALRLQAFFMSA